MEKQMPDIYANESIDVHAVIKKSGNKTKHA